MQQKKAINIVQQWGGPSCPGEVHWPDVCTVLKSIGFELVSDHATHHVFYHKGLEDYSKGNILGGQITVVASGKKRQKTVKKAYLQDIFRCYRHLKDKGEY